MKCIKWYKWSACFGFFLRVIDTLYNLKEKDGKGMTIIQFKMTA
jgi:hypothetical protein